jgi:hypothetical protein
MPKSYKRWVSDVIADVSNELNLQGWRIKVCFDVVYPNNETDTVCFIDCLSDYYKATIHLTPYAQELWNDENFEVLSECLVHELVHILVDPVYQFAKKQTSEITFPFLTTMNEQTTQRITRVLLQFLPKKIFSR